MAQDNYDDLFNEIGDWIYQQGFPDQSLDELVYSDRMIERFMTDEQRKQAQEYIDRFNKL